MSQRSPVDFGELEGPNGVTVLDKGRAISGIDQQAPLIDVNLEFIGGHRERPVCLKSFRLQITSDILYNIRTRV
ncbi:hypothetical protein U8C33_37465 (plasmid) [Sinorhizobium meliloti]|nr:hypothetical protein U8C33_37465 [Sinorhizobium meliloti]